MKPVTFKWLSLIMLLAAAIALSACNKKVAKVTPPSPPPAPAPSATLAANPNVLEQGQSAELTWQTQNADTITIAGLGTVPASGSRTVTPNDSITYTLTAKGPGGSGEATARVTVNPKPRVVSMAGPSDEELFSQNVKDVFFDFDRYELRSTDAPTATQNAEFLRQHPNIKVIVEGHCDDRGSDEYNLALGANRAGSLKQALVAQGVSADRIQTVSYGKEKPFCNADDEQCWQQNRRDHFAFGR